MSFSGERPREGAGGWAQTSRVAAVLALLAVLQVPDGAGAVVGQDDEVTPREEREEVRERQGEVEIEIDALEGELDEVADALVILNDNVADRRDELDEAERALTDAEDDLELAEEAVDDAEDDIEELESANDDLMMSAFMTPPVDNVRTTFSSGSMGDATLRRVLIDLTSDTNADVGDQLDAAHEDLDLEQDNLETVAADAEDARDEVADSLADLEGAVEQQNGFAADAELALEARLAEAATLADRETELDATIEEEEWAELVSQLEAVYESQPAEPEGGEAGPAGSGGGDDPPEGGESSGTEEPVEAETPSPAPTSPPATSPPATSPPATSPPTTSPPAPPPLPAATISPAPGGLATVNCPGGGSITVAGTIASNLRDLLNAAADSGLLLCGSGYRDPSRQIALRQQNCGTSSYAIYQMPPSQCSPPTARPGSSLHEQGLAIDFANCATRATACYRWLAGNASRFGLYNLPSEPWHWSTTGS